MGLDNLIFLNLFLYLFGFLIMLALTNTGLEDLSGWISVFLNILGIIVSSSIQIFSGETSSLEYHWIKLKDVVINFKILVDYQTFFMYIIVQVIAVIVQLYSTRYLQFQAGQHRYFAYINLFVFSMLGLVLAGNLFQLYFFWELVGFCSFLLINFFYYEKRAVDASFKAFIMNRFGDLFLMAGIFTLIYLYGNVDFEYWVQEKGRLLAQIKKDNLHLVHQLSILAIFVGVSAKSAQFPLHTWLPDAMIAPAPASALIHAATMVVSGVFLLGRINPLISSQTGFVIAFVGATTAMIAAFSGIFQNDIKKVLAYSTISQIGYMVAAMGMKEVGASLFHLSTHAFFKAGLFLCVGVVIDYLHHEQDMRKMGNLAGRLPVVYISYLICAFSLIGLPFTSGFLSKESILAVSLDYAQFSPVKLVIPALLLISSLFTAIYIGKQVMLVFLDTNSNPLKNLALNVKDVFLKFVKTLEGLYTAEEVESDSGQLLQFFQRIGYFDLSVMALAFASLYFLFGSTPFHLEENWFFENFKGSPGSYYWLPYVSVGLALVGLFIGYQVATRDRLNFDAGQTDLTKIQKLGLNHFYIDAAYVDFLGKIFYGKDGESRGISGYFVAFEQNILNKGIQKLANGFMQIPRLFLWIEERLITPFVLEIGRLLSKASSQFKELHDGQIQNYIVGLFAAIFIFALFINLFF